MVSRRPRLSHQWRRVSTLYWPPHPSAYSSDSDSTRTSWCASDLRACLTSVTEQDAFQYSRSMASKSGAAGR